ncbi:hypothetical protein EDC01DRAFT_784614 [Geopyxis carbonaria]|nr:hypothetical protein EDC01DRAFT_784614 [Geopyxis carbonaria]
MSPMSSFVAFFLAFLGLLSLVASLPIPHDGATKPDFALVPSPLDGLPLTILEGSSILSTLLGSSAEDDYEEDADEVRELMELHNGRRGWGYSASMEGRSVV